MPPNKSPQTVVLIHGLMGNRFDMWPIARRMRKLGYRDWSWNYRSIGRKIETHVQRLGEDLAKFDRETESCFHLVTHSMGGIITRAVLDRWRYQHLAKVIMLAPPHGGSHVARKLAPWFDWLTPSLSQLSDESDSFVNQLPNSLLDQRIMFGIIEASRDRVIAPGKTLIDGYEDYVSVDGHHGVLPWYRQTQKLVEQFIVEGNFDLGIDSTRDLPPLHARTTSE